MDIALGIAGVVILLALWTRPSKWVLDLAESLEQDSSCDRK